VRENRGLMRLLEEDIEKAAQTIPMPKEVPAEIKALIDAVLGGFNSKDSALCNSAFGGDVVIVDGMAPYRWTRPNAQGRWFADAEEWAHDLGVTDENIAYDRIVHAEVVGAHGYLVLSATLSFALKGQRGSRRGILTFTFAKQGDSPSSSAGAKSALTFGLSTDFLLLPGDSMSAQATMSAPAIGRMPSHLDRPFT